MELSLSAQVAMVVIPAAIYFLLLGLLNSRPNPQLVSGRTDFIILNAAFFPLACVPIMSFLGASAWGLLATVAAILAAARLLAPERHGNWVIYNITLPEALKSAERVLREMGEPFSRQGRRLVLPGRDVELRFSSVPLLRNVSLSAQGDGSRSFSRQFEGLFGRQLSAVRTPASAMAITFLLLAAGLLVAPLGLLANRVPEMVRLITHLAK